MNPSETEIKAYMQQWVEAKYCRFLADNSDGGDYIPQPLFCHNSTFPSEALVYHGISMGGPDHGLGLGAILGIVFGSLAGIIILVCLAAIACRKGHDRPEQRRREGGRSWFGGHALEG